MAPAELWGRDGASLFCFDVCSRMREFEPSNWIKVSGYISLSAGICLGSDARRFFFLNWNLVGPVRRSHLCSRGYGYTLALFVLI